MAAFHHAKVNIALNKIKTVQRRGGGKDTYRMKVYNKRKTIESKMVSDVLYERYIIQQLNHPYVASIKYAFQDEFALYMITDTADSDFRACMNANKGFNDSQLRVLAAEIASALDHLHTKFVVYRY